MEMLDPQIGCYVHTCVLTISAEQDWESTTFLFLPQSRFVCSVQRAWSFAIYSCVLVTPADLAGAGRQQASLL
ncbi:hypothetical protein SK128_008093 [Halocaridina rubra]|uniref:Uncharacterized protein n=1 Tax=Halocaridina rubra TaxID=373956 RepID=A0AAN9A5J8_HALRR